MSRIALINDTHFGVRGNNEVFLNNQIDFFQNFFIPELKKRKISRIIHLGDVFDVRKNINIKTLSRVKTEIFDKFWDEGIDIVIAVGNHDVVFKNTNKYNSPTELLGEYNNIKIIDSEPEVVEGMGIMPWICADNYDASMDFLKDTTCEIILGHFEIAGFEMHSGIPCLHGMKAETFKRFKTVLSGHFHTRSSRGNITYLGTQYEMTWADCDDPKGFNILDTNTGDVDFVHYDNVMFHKLVYDKTPPAMENYKDKYVKVVVREADDRKELDKFLDAIRFTEPMDLKIIENEREYHIDESLDVDVEDTVSLMDKYVDTLELENVKPNRIKTILKSLHTEALEME